MERDKLFVQTVDWLDAKSQTQPPDEHELLITAARLRLLLLDEQPLVHQVNKSRRFDIRYRILRHGELPAGLPLPDLWCVPDGLSPDLVPPGHRIPVESVKLDAFLHERVMIYQREDVTVRDLIKHVANVGGGVHAGRAKTQKDEKLDELAEFMTIQGMDVAIR